MDDVTKSAYAEWLEDLIQIIMEKQPEKIGVCMSFPDGCTLTSYFGGCCHNDKAIMAHTFNLDAIWEVTTANAKEIMEAAEEQGGDENEG